MKRIKLLLAAFAAMLGLTAQAQTWTASEVGEGSFVLYNVGAGQFFTKGNAWGTQASITSGSFNDAINGALTLKLEKYGDNYKLRTDVNGSGYGVENLVDAGAIYTDQSRGKNSTWTFTQVSTDNGPVYTIVSADNHGGGAGAYLTANSSDTKVNEGTDGASAYAQWKLMSTTTKSLLSVIDRYNTVKTAATAIVSGLDTTDPDAAVAAATTADDIESAIAMIRKTFLAELPNLTVPTDPGYIDVTAVMVDNAGVHTNTDFWTIEGTKNGGYSWAVCNYGECEFYQQNFKFYQTLKMARGTWEFGVTGFHRAGNHNTHFYAGDDKILIPGVESSVVNTMAQAQTYFDNGNGKVALKFIIESVQDVEIGIDNKDTQTDKWTIFRDFTLKYYGAPDYSVYAQQWAEAVAAANAAKLAHVSVTGQELADLNAAIADAPDGSSKANYLEKIQTLAAATQAFTAAAASYDKYAAYKAETVTLFGTDFNVAAPTTAAEAEVAVQNLNVAQFNKVAADYPYSLTSKIGDFSTWTGTATLGAERTPDTPNSLDWEHWSGVTHSYYEQCGNGYGNAGGWTIQYTKTTKLPAGSYVVKVAARSSLGVTSQVSCSALNTTISLPCAGNNTRGINTDGKASWNADDTFISTGGLNASVGGTGAGWQWRFLPFTLTEETEVTMTFYAEATTGSQWMSIADGELLSTENIATAVAYADNEANTIKDVDLANVTIARTVKEGFNTVVLPFDLTSNQVEAAFGTGTEVYAFSDEGTDPNFVTVNFNKVIAGTITANVPVLVKATAESSSQVFNGVEVKAPTADVKVAGTYVNFVGVYAPATVAADNFFVGNGALYKSAGATNIKAFRAYIDAKETGSEVKMFIDGLETSISEIMGEKAENGAIYNLAGQRVQKAQKGIYVINGKKVLVK